MPGTETPCSPKARYPITGMWPTACSTSAGISLIRNRDPLRVRLTLAAFALVGVHIVTIVFFQNQFRYMVPALPALLVVLGLAASAVIVMVRSGKLSWKR